MWTSLKTWSGKVARVLRLETDYPPSPLSARRRPGPGDGNPELSPVPDRHEALTSVLEISLGGGSEGQTPRGRGQALAHRRERAWLPGWATAADVKTETCCVQGLISLAFFS